MKILITIALIVFNTMAWAKDIVWFFEGTYVFTGVEPVSTKWSHLVYGSTSQGKIELKEYREQGYTCTHLFSMRYQCELLKKNVLPQDLENRILKKFNYATLDFEPYQSYRPITFQENEWRFQQTVLVDFDDLYFDSYIYKDSAADGIIRLVMSKESDYLVFEATDKWTLFLMHHEKSGDIESIVKIKLEKLTP